MRDPRDDALEFLADGDTAEALAMALIFFGDSANRVAETILDVFGGDEPPDVVKGGGA